MEDNDDFDEIIPNIQFECDDGEPMHLVKYIDNKFELDIDTIQYLLNYSGAISFVDICGKYRTGKSFLLNKINSIENCRTNNRTDQ